MMTTVSPAINSTSHPFQTGFFMGGAAGTGTILAAAKGSGVLNVGVSPLTGGRSNCGFSDEDKNILFLSTAYLIPCFAKTSLLTHSTVILSEAKDLCNPHPHAQVQRFCDPC